MQARKTRFLYGILILNTLVLGISSRKYNEIPLFLGDILYAALIYFGFRFWLLISHKRNQILFPTLFCFGIEFLQLCQAGWLVSLRKTNLGHYVFGQGFLWSDLGCYVLGILFAYLCDNFIILKTRN